MVKKIVKKPTLKKTKTVAKKNTATVSNTVSVPAAANDLKGMVKTHWHFMSLIVLFAGFSLYAIVSFSGSTNNYIKGMYASVVGSDQAAISETPAAYAIFSDVKSDAPNAVAIEKLRDLGVFGGYKDGTFKPGNFITRAETFAVTATAADIDFAGASYGDCFKDVKNEWFAVPVCYAKKQGWVAGYADGSFKPSEEVGYPEVLKSVISIFGFEVPKTVATAPMTGVSEKAWFAPYFKVAIDFGIIDGDFVFDPTYKLTRADFSEVVYRAMKARGLF